jgi:hypothetical protein
MSQTIMPVHNLVSIHVLKDYSRCFIRTLFRFKKMPYYSQYKMGFHADRGAYIWHWRAIVYENNFVVVCIYRDIAFPCIINETLFKIAFSLFNHSILSFWLIYGGVGEGYVWYGMSVSEYAGLVDVVDIWGYWGLVFGGVR